MGTLVYPRYNLVWDTSQFRGTPLLVGFTNSNWANVLDDWNSNVGYVFSLGSGPITWDYKKKNVLSFY
jgi:hypothetical protein